MQSAIQSASNPVTNCHQLNALAKEIDALSRENQFYRTELNHCEKTIDNLTITIVDRNRRIQHLSDLLLLSNNKSHEISGLPKQKRPCNISSSSQRSNTSTPDIYKQHLDCFDPAMPETSPLKKPGFCSSMTFEDENFMSFWNDDDNNDDAFSSVCSNDLGFVACSSKKLDKSAQAKQRLRERNGRFSKSPSKKRRPIK